MGIVERMPTSPRGRWGTDEPDRGAELAHRNLRNYETGYNTLAEVCDVQGDMVPAPPIEVSRSNEGR